MIVDWSVVDALKQRRVDVVRSLVVAIGILSLHVAASVLIIQIPLALITVWAWWVVGGHLSVVVGINLDFRSGAPARRRRCCCCCRAGSWIGAIWRRRSTQCLS